MALTLYVDTARWRAHHKQVSEQFPGLVPVCKGNGYGFGLRRLARRAQWLGVDTVAVGTYEELPEVHQRFPGSMVVLSPWRPSSPTPGELGVDPARVVHTVGRPGDLEALVAQMTEVPLLINPRTVAPGVVPGATAPVFTFAGEAPTDEG